MSDLQAAILARIDATPYRPPHFQDLVFIGPHAAISWALAELMTARVIDTATGDSGVTYTRRKVHTDAPYSSPHAPAPIPQTAHAGLAYFPSRSPTAQPVWHGPENTPSQRATLRACSVPRIETRQELARARAELLAIAAKKRKAERDAETAKRRAIAAKIKANKAAESRGQSSTFATSRALIAAHLTRPMSSAMFASAAGIDPKKSAAMLANQARAGRLQAINSVPKLFLLHGMDDKNARDEAAKNKIQSRLAKLGYDAEKVANEYAAGSKINEIQARYGGSKSGLRKCVRLCGGQIRTQAQNSWMAPRNKRIDAFAGRAEA
jgi:hypothetical protein